MRQRVVLGTAVVALLAPLAGCSPDLEEGTTLSSTSSGSASSSSASETTAPTTTASPTQTFPPEQQPIIDAYMGFFTTLNGLGMSTYDEALAALSPFAEPTLAASTAERLQEFLAKGKMPSGVVVFGPMSVETSGAAYVVNECRDASSERVVSTSDGSEISQGNSNLMVEVLLGSGSGGWKVANYEATADGC